MTITYLFTKQNPDGTTNTYDIYTIRPLLKSWLDSFNEIDRAAYLAADERNRLKQEMFVGPDDQREVDPEFHRWYSRFLADSNLTLSITYS